MKFFYSIEELKTINQQKAALYLSFLIFLSGTLAIISGLIYPLTFALLPEPFHRSFSVDVKFFNTIIGVFGFGALVSAFFTDFIFIKSNKLKINFIIGGIILGIINVILNLPLMIYYFKKTNLNIFYDMTHILSTTSVIANFILPTLVISLILSIYSAYRFVISKNIQKKVKMRKLSLTVLHIGIILALFGTMFSYNNTQINDLLLKPNTEGYITTDQSTSLKVLDTNYERFGSNFERRLQAKVQLIENNRIIGTGLLEYTEYTYYGLVVSVLIISSLTADYYLTISTFTVNDANNSLGDIRFQISIIPMINLLWTGSLLVLFTSLILVLMSFRLFKYSYTNTLRKKFLIPRNSLEKTKNIPLSQI